MSLPTDDSKALATSKLFRDLAASELKAVFRAGWRTQIACNGFFYRQGDPATRFYVLLAGRAKLTRLTPDGHQTLLQVISPGEGFGIVTRQKGIEYSLSAQAVNECLAVVWDVEILDGLLQRYPRIALNALEVLAEQCLEWQQRYQELATEYVEQRVAQALLRLAQQAGSSVKAGVLIDLPLSRQEVADMTGTTLYTASRILNCWEHDGLVELGRERVVIRHWRELVAIAEALPGSADR